jgi:hypothetical protein
MVSVFVFDSETGEVVALYYSLDFHSAPLSALAMAARAFAILQSFIGSARYLSARSPFNAASISGAAAIRRAFSLHSGVKPWRISTISVPSFP